MTPEDTDRQRAFPTNWDVLSDAAVEDDLDLPPDPGDPAAASPPTIALVSAFWADAVTVLAVVTAALLAINLAGHTLHLAVLPWALVLGAAWWVFAAAVLITVRQGTPGMLLAGVHFSDRVAPPRVVGVILVVAVGAALLGLPGLLGARRSPVAAVGGRPIETIPVD